MAKQLNGCISGGDSDGVAYFMDKPCIVSFTEDERSGWLNRFAEEELMLGVYFSDNRIVPADFVILQRGNRIDAEQLPPYGLNLYTKLASTMKTFAEDANHARSHSIRVMDNDNNRNFTLAEVVPVARKADKPRALEVLPISRPSFMRWNTVVAACSHCRASSAPNWSARKVLWRVSS